MKHRHLNRAMIAKHVVKGLAFLAFIAVAAYGLTQFLEASDVRNQTAEAVAFCNDKGGVAEFETFGTGQGWRVACKDGAQGGPREATP